MGISNSEASSSSITNRGFLVVGVLVALLVLTPFLGGDVTGEATRRQARPFRDIDFTYVSDDDDVRFGSFNTPVGRFTSLTHGQRLEGALRGAGIVATAGISTELSANTIDRDFVKCNDNDFGADIIKKGKLVYTYKSRKAQVSKRHVRHTVKLIDSCVGSIVEGNKENKLDESSLLVEYSCFDKGIAKTYVPCKYGCKLGKCRNYDRQASLDYIQGQTGQPTTAPTTRG